MPGYALALLAGVMVLECQPALLPLAWTASFPLVALLGRRWRAARLLSAFLAGLLWANLMAHWQQPAQLPPQLLQDQNIVEGRVVGLPRVRSGQTSFLFEIDRLPGDPQGIALPQRVSLVWYEQAPALIPGGRWRLHCRLRTLRGLLNPGGFDYQGWLYRQGVRYRGSVVAGERLSPGGGLDAWRAELATRLVQTAGEDDASAVLRAVVVGDQGGMSPVLRDVFSATGSSHLMAISGLHIGLVSGLVFALGGQLWRRMRLARRWPAPVVAAVPALLAASGYAALAGFAIPTQRALLMLLVVLLALIGRWRPSPARGLAAALMVVLLADPRSVHDAGFWLSFAAVAVLLAAADGRGWHRWLRPQLAIGLGLLPLLVVLGMQVPLIGPLANLLMIPWYGLLVVPPALLGALMLMLDLPLAEWLLWFAGQAVALSLSLLRWLAGYDLVIGFGGAGIAGMMLAIAGVAILLMPAGLPGRHLGAMLLLPLLFPRPERPAPGSFDLQVLDVGQGLAVVVETRRHLLVYDTGPRYRSGFETGSAVILPYLRQRGWRAIDLLLLSHADSDHSGGTGALLEALPVGRILVGEAVAEAPAARPCRAGQSWQWDGVDFEVLAPAAADRFQGNDSSCVLRIRAGSNSALLTGDIERRAELALLQETQDIAARVVTAPHHGSASSSSAEFVQAVAADWVVFAAGHQNRWGFPRDDVVSRWRESGARGLNTAESGAVRFHFDPVLRPAPQIYRARHRRYWLE